MKEKLRIIFMGTPEFAVEPLKMLVSGGYEVVLAVTQPDKARDRGKKVKMTPVKEAALEAGIPVVQPEKIKNNEEFLQNLREIKPDIIIVAAYGKILPVELLEIPRLGCVNIHASLLPRFRGAAPIQRCIMAGDEKTGVTLMYMAEGLDTGDMIAKSETPIDHKTADDLHDELAKMGAALLLEYLPKIASGDVNPQKQDDLLSCYAPMIDKSEGKLDFNRDAAELERIVRGIGTSPGTFAIYNNERMKIKRCHYSSDNSGKPSGTVVNADKNGICVACGSGTLVLEEIQMPGKKSMTAADYLKGNKIETGTILG